MPMYIMQHKLIATRIPHKKNRFLSIIKALILHAHSCSCEGEKISNGRGRTVVKGIEMDGGFRCILYCSIVYVSGIIRDFVLTCQLQGDLFRSRVLYDVENVYELLNTQSYKTICTVYIYMYIYIYTLYKRTA